MCQKIRPNQSLRFRGRSFDEQRPAQATGVLLMNSKINNQSAQEQVSALYARHQAWLVTHLIYRMNNKADAEDICQQIFLRLCEYPSHLETIRNPRAWLATTANRLCIDRWRRETGARKVVDAMGQQPVLDAPSPERVVEGRQILSSVVDQLEALPGKVTSIFIDTRVHALTGKQVAESHNVSLRTVRNHLNLTTQLLASTHRVENVPAAAGLV